MPGISNRGNLAPASPIRKLVPYAEAAKKSGTKVYHLNIGQPDIPTPPAFADAVRNADLGIIAYSHSAGNESLRKKIIDYYGRYGIELTLNHLLVTTGGSEALRFAFMSCMDPGDEVIIPEPFYANYNSFSIESGVKVVPITTNIEDNFDLPSTEIFESLITPRTKAIMICNPSNPTGKLYSREALEQLRDIALKHNLFIIADEVYREFAYDGEKHTSVLSLEGLRDHAIVVDSISKRYAACGARIGTIVSHNETVIATALKFAQARLSPPTLAQIGAEAVYQLEHSYFKPVIEEYVSRRDVLVNALSQIEGVVVPEVHGAFYMTVRLPVDDTDKFCQWMLESFSHEGATVMMAPASGFYATKGAGKDEVRIAYVLNTTDLEHAMQCLEAGLRTYPGNMVQATAVKQNS